MDANGNFAISATAYNVDGNGNGVQVRKFSSTGTALTNVLNVNTYTTGGQEYASVAANNDGTFEVVWQSYNQDGSGYGIYGQKFNANGTKSGTEFRINSYTAGDQSFTNGNFGNNIATDNNGNLAVVWNSVSQESANNSGIYGKRLNADGSCYTYVPTNTAPVITSNAGGTSATVNVAENTTAVTTVTANDAESNTITYSISGGADQSKFSISISTGALRFIAAPDFENSADADHNNIYSVIVRATDNGTGSLYDEQTINVTVTDVAEDVTPPVVTGVVNGGSYSSARTISYNEGTATLNGVGYEGNITVSLPGSYNLVVTDAAGNTTSVSFTIVAAITVSDIPNTNCANSNVNVFYASNQTFNSGNTFSVELSDATGSFASPSIIGSYTGTLRVHL